jgi:hypothetical protein
MSQPLPIPWTDLVPVDVTIQDPNVAQVSLSEVLFISSDSTLGGTDRVRSYGSYAEVAAALTAGTVSATAAAAAAIAFGQPRKPDAFLIGRRNGAGSETWAAAYAAIIADPLGATAFGICIDSRADANILAVAAAIATEGERLGFFQANNADLLSGALSSSTLAALAGNDFVRLYYHTTDSEYLDVAHAVDRLAWDADEQSVPWNSAVAGVATYAELTAAQKAQALANNVNIMRLFGSETRWVDPGRDMESRPGHQQVTRLWFKVRLAERAADLLVTRSAAGLKLPLNAAGQTIVVALVENLLLDGVTAGHFEADQWSVTAEDISSTDISLARLRFSGYARFMNSARVLSFSFDFTSSEVS